MVIFMFSIRSRRGNTIENTKGVFYLEVTLFKNPEN